MKNLEKQGFPAPKNESTPASEKSAKIESLTLLQLQKSSFLFFLITSMFVVFCCILMILMPEIAFLTYYSPEMLILIELFSFGFLIVHLNRKLAWLGPVLIIALLPLTLTRYLTFMYSICAFIIALIELNRLGFFKHTGLFKACILISYYAWNFALVTIMHKEFFLDMILSITFLSLFFIYLIPIIQDRSQIGKVDLAYRIYPRDLNLTCREMDFLRDCLNGATFKEIAYKHHVSESTVRNTFAHIYHKFNVVDRIDLMSKLAAFDIIDE